MHFYAYIEYLNINNFHARIICGFLKENYMNSKNIFLAPGAYV